MRRFQAAFWKKSYLFICKRLSKCDPETIVYFLPVSLFFKPQNFKFPVHFRFIFGSRNSEHFISGVLTFNQNMRNAILGWLSRFENFLCLKSQFLVENGQLVRWLWIIKMVKLHFRIEPEMVYFGRNSEWIESFFVFWVLLIHLACIYLYVNRYKISEFRFNIPLYGSP